MEHLKPARQFPAVPRWRLKCALVFMPLGAAIGMGIPFLFDPLVAGRALLPGHRLGVFWGALVGIVSSEFILYWVHRFHHKLAFLWCWIHQLHHSAERVDVYGAAYFHPFELLEGSIIGVFFFGYLLGLVPEAAGLAILWQVFAGVFQHGNIHTPRWLGYLIQRPEQHCLHHERGSHAFNFSNLPVFDLLFGTFRNPRVWSGDAGFYSGASTRTLAMLAGRDVSTPLQTNTIQQCRGE